MWQNIGKVTGHFIDLIWPHSCLACKARTENQLLCDQCLDVSKKATTTALTPPNKQIDAPLARWAFDGHAPIRAVMHRLKYGNCPWIGHHLGVAIAKDIACQEHLDQPAVVPIPLFHTRLLERGYNQSEWICSGISEALGLPLEANTLIRTRNTRSQTTMSRQERAGNVSGAFATSQDHPLEGRVVVLVDDTVTTGATLFEASMALIRAGVRRVHPVCVARAALRMSEEQQEGLRPYEADT